MSEAKKDESDLSALLCVSFGGGTNSTAMLIGLWERGIRPDFITFADTGGEKPHTYRHIEDMQRWLKKVGFPEIVIVKKVDKNGDVLTLEDNCLQQKMLPSLAYGFKSCSQKFKIAPQDKYFNNLPKAKDEWKSGGKLTKLIGYDAGESRRAEKDYSDNKYNFSYPLIEWGWHREDCIAAIDRAGLPQPSKSSCFFCPANKVPEIKEMQALYPELIERAITMEKNAQLTQVKGLGRNFAWANVIATDDMFTDSYIELACGCYDG